MADALAIVQGGVVTQAGLTGGAATGGAMVTGAGVGEAARVEILVGAAAVAVGGGNARHGMMICRW